MENEYALQDVKEQILRQLEVLYREHTPEFIYFVTLYNLFKDFLQETRDYSTLQTKTGFENTIVWNKLYDFQRDGVIGAINKIETYGGCIIADSVGLGKHLKHWRSLNIMNYGIIAFLCLRQKTAGELGNLSRE